MPAIFANRSPKLPIETPRTRSPGESVFTTAASRPPDPAHVSIATSPVVPKNGFIPSRIRASIAANSGPRWLIIWRPPASRTDGGRAVGPGILRFGSKRSTNGSPGQPGDVELPRPGGLATVPRWSQTSRIRATRGCLAPDAQAALELGWGAGAGSSSDPGRDRRSDARRYAPG